MNLKRLIPPALAMASVAVAVVGYLTVGAPAAAASAGRSTAVAIGDSIMDGHNLQPDQAWPAIIAHDDDWSLTNLAADGDGFVTVGNDGTTFLQQVRETISLHPQVVVLSASSNDLGVPEPEVRSAMVEAVDELHAALPKAQIIGFSAIWNENDSPPQLDQMGTDLRAAVSAVGGTYLDIGNPLKDRPDLMQGGDVHPTAAGQLTIAAAVQSALAKAGLVS
ncbi:SGNH/GDSL hydrolase family protein [Humibacter sp.]|uniref:SGNH/GDSL hydrolase family protein n=1 Tax=Humibacter sp. TaxID=1940291 RepID=UPI003F8233B7